MKTKVTIGYTYQDFSGSETEYHVHEFLTNDAFGKGASHHRPLRSTIFEIMKKGLIIVRSDGSSWTIPAHNIQRISTMPVGDDFMFPGMEEK